MNESKRRGRPPLEPGKAKRASFNTRLRSALKFELEAAAEREGRSLSEEIEFRLERSLEVQKRYGDALRQGIAIGGYLTLALVLGKQSEAFAVLGLPVSDELAAAQDLLAQALDLSHQENQGLDTREKAQTFRVSSLKIYERFYNSVGDAVAQKAPAAGSRSD